MATHRGHHEDVRTHECTMPCIPFIKGNHVILWFYIQLQPESKLISCTLRLETADLLSKRLYGTVHSSVFQSLSENCLMMATLAVMCSI